MIYRQAGLGFGSGSGPGLGLKRKKPVKYYLVGIAPVIVLMLMALPFWGFVSRVVMANPLLNGKIIGVMMIGVCIVMQRIYLVQKEYAVLDRFMAALLSGRPMSALLEEPSIKDSRVAHVLENVVETEGRISSQMVQTAMIKELDHVEHSFKESYDIPNFVVGFMISLGLLGTFIGLLETMVGLSDMLGSIQNQASGDLSKAVMGLIGKLQAPLAGMGTAFAASLFGLVGSSVLAIMMLSLKYAVAQFMHAFRRYLAVVVDHQDNDLFEPLTLPAKAAETVIASDRMSDSFIKELTAQMAEQHAMSHDLFRQSERTLINAIVRVDSLTDHVGQLFEVMKAHVEVNKKMYELLSYGPRMRELSEQTLAELRTLSAGQHRQEEGLNKVTHAIASVDQLMGHMSGQLAQIGQSFEFLNAGVGGMAKENNQGVQVAIDIARHLAEANATLNDIKQNNETLAKIQEASAQHTVLAEMMLDEFRNTRTTVVRDVRAEFRELFRNMAELGQGNDSRPKSS